MRKLSKIHMEALIILQLKKLSFTEVQYLQKLTELDNDLLVGFFCEF